MTQQFVELSEIIAKGSGSVNPASYLDEHFELYSIPAFDVGEPEAKTGAEIGSSKQVVKPGDVLLSKIVPHIRRTWIVGPANGKRIIASSEWIVFRGERFDPKYLRHVLVGDPFHSEFMNTVAGVGGSLLRARPSHVAKIKIPLPPLPEQKRIAEILDRAEALRAKRRAALALLDELTQSIFLDMFGDPDFDGKESVAVADLVDEERGGIRTGPFGSQLLHSEFTDSGIAVLGIDNAVQNEFAWKQRRFISESKYRQLKRYTVYPGDVIITIMGTCGRCAIVPANIPTAINTKHLCCISLDRSRCVPEFLHAYFLKHPVAQSFLRDRAKGAIMSGLNMGIIKEMPVPLYSLNEQTKFAKLIVSVAAEKQLLIESAQELDQLFAALQHRAFRGEL